MKTQMNEKKCISFILRQHFINRPNQVSWNDNEAADTQLGRFQEKGVEIV